MLRLENALVAAAFILSAVPLVLGTVASTFWLPEVYPTHIGLDGVIDGWGGGLDWLLFAASMSFVDVVCALCCLFIDQLWAAGMVNGVRTKLSARALLVASIAFIDILYVGILVWQITYSA